MPEEAERPGVGRREHNRRRQREGQKARWSDGYTGEVGGERQRKGEDDRGWRLRYVDPVSAPRMLLIDDDKLEPDDEPRTDEAMPVRSSASNGHANDADFEIFGWTVICETREGAHEAGVSKRRRLDGDGGLLGRGGQRTPRMRTPRWIV